MADFDVIKKKLEEYIKTVKNICKNLDKNGLGVSSYIPDSDTENFCMLSLSLFNIYVGLADGTLDEKEIKVLNDLAGTHFVKTEFMKIAETAEITKDSFAEELPIVLNVFVDGDNSDNAFRETNPISLTLYELFATSGVCVMASNEKVATDEYDRLLNYLEKMYKFIKKNLKQGYVDIKRPADIVKSTLDLTGIEVNQTKEDLKKADKLEKDNKKDPEEKTLQDLIDELNSLIGLDEVKYDVTSLTNMIRIKNLREQMNLKMPPVSLHLVFSGNPGTGKTTVARLIAQIYKQVGVLSKGHLVEVDRSGLVGGYVGQTALKVKDVIESAMGGVLFIDEAYSLTPADIPNDYGFEAVDTIIKAMEDHRDDLIVIVAGYPELMKRFLSSNPGLKSRFNKFIYFRDYTPEEMTKIFLSFCDKNGYRASRPALEHVQELMVKKCEEKTENFANAREVRNLFEYALSRQANRVIMIPNPDQKDLTLLKRSDVSGEDINIGKQQFMAQKVINDLTREKRYGLGMEHMNICIDELELAAVAEEILYKNQINYLSDLMDYLDKGKKITDIEGISEENADEIEAELAKLGFEK